MFDRNGILTDDADRMVYGCDEFVPGDDYDPMYEGPGGGPRCGGCGLDDEGRWVGPGCRHCDPVDYENMPGSAVHGYGEGPAWDRAYKHFRNEFKFLTGRSESAPNDFPGLLRKWAVGFGWDERRVKCADLIWKRLCDRCETHGEAREKFLTWANRTAQS